MLSAQHCPLELSERDFAHCKPNKEKIEGKIGKGLGLQCKNAQHNVHSVVSTESHYTVKTVEK